MVYRTPGWHQASDTAVLRPNTPFDPVEGKMLGEAMLVCSGATRSDALARTARIIEQELTPTCVLVTGPVVV